MRKPRATPPASSATETAEEGSFLSRWARRKRIALRGGDPDRDDRQGDQARAPKGAGDRPGDQRSAQTAQVAAQAAADEPAADDASRREPTDVDIPALDVIDDSTDMSGFFSSKVSEGLKRAALRKFFHSPAFNVVDGLDDYAEDFTSFAPLGDLVTADMRHRMDQEAERAREALEARAEADGEPRSETPTGTARGDRDEANATRDTRESAGEDARGDVRVDVEGDTEGDTEGDAPDRRQAAHAGTGVSREPGVSGVSGKLRRRAPGSEES